MHIILAGYSGLTGSSALAQLQAHQGVEKIYCVGRRPPEHDFKTEFVPLDNVKGEISSPEATAVACCVETTMAKAGSKEAFRKVDYDIPVNLAKWTKQRASRFVLMSSVGANISTGNFYLKTKGETEAAVREVFQGPVFVLRPSILLGPRKENRFGERVGIALGKIAAPLMFGKYGVYKPIKAEDVAAAMVNLATSDSSAPEVLHYDEIMRLARTTR